VNLAFAMLAANTTLRAELKHISSARLRAALEEVIPAGDFSRTSRADLIELAQMYGVIADMRERGELGRRQ